MQPWVPRGLSAVAAGVPVSYGLGDWDLPTVFVPGIAPQLDPDSVRSAGRHIRRSLGEQRGFV